MSDAETALTAETTAVAGEAQTALVARPGLGGLSASRVLEALAAEDEPARVSLDAILARLDDRAFGMLMILLALPNCLPLPPFGSTVFGVAIILVALQLVFGRHRPWIPGFIRRRSLARADFRLAVGKAAPLLHRLERLCRPRLPMLANPLAERLVGIVIVVLAVVIAVPIPIIGNMPPAVVVGILSISLIERDGLAVLFGLVLAVVIVAINAGLVGAAALAVAAGIEHLVERLF